jgi:hypothetical protein
MIRFVFTFIATERDTRLTAHSDLLVADIKTAPRQLVSPSWKFDPLFGPRSRGLAWLDV